MVSSSQTGSIPYFANKSFSICILCESIDEIKAEFKFENGDIKSIEPIKNRLVVFDSQITHRGCAPEIPGFLRISLAWKLKRM